MLLSARPIPTRSRRYPILLEAEESERALRWGMKNLVDAVYHADADGVLGRRGDDAVAQRPV